ncbi:MAG TPA: V-type ATP synthase subunit E [Candidatus Blautia excrementipullorum]|nr:V-type ATP synthase subunit E [Candidatus Blautia excrementipullorum]
MNGLEKIISQIEEEASHSAEDIIQEAREQAKAILSEADEECKKIKAEAEDKAKAQREDILRKSRSAARMREKRELLQEKQRLIGEILEEAKTALYELDGKSYFLLIAKMLEKHVQPGKGVICFNERDLNRLPEGFEQTIQETAARKGGELKVNRTPGSIDGGFLLVYGGIEENCSFASLFADERERLQDKISSMLFEQKPQ